MKIIPTEISGLILLEPKAFGDARGFFFESYQINRYREAGITENFVQDNVSRSSKGILRGLHYQLVQPQGKLVYVTRGEVFDVAVDLRRSSPTFGRWFGVLLNDENHRQLYVPPGFAHGFYVTSETASVLISTIRHMSERCCGMTRPWESSGHVSIHRFFPQKTSKVDCLLISRPTRDEITSANRIDTW